MTVSVFLRTGSSELRVGRSLKNGWFSFFLFCRTWGQGVAVCARGVFKKACGEVVGYQSWI